MKPHRGVLILVFGILSLVICPLFGLAAWSMANKDLPEMDHGWMDRSGRDLTQAGRICGMIATGILTIQMLALSIFGLSMLMRS